MDIMNGIQHQSMSEISLLYIILLIILCSLVACNFGAGGYEPPEFIICFRSEWNAFYINNVLLNSGESHCALNQVAAVPEDVGTAGALRAVARHLTADDILVCSWSLFLHFSWFLVLFSFGRSIVSFDCHILSST